MESSQHFSHQHPLLFHQVPQGSQTHCSGCKSPASGNVFVCWQCSYFLHEQCYRATRSFHHPSHPHHPLTLVPSPTYPSASFVCNSCSLAGDGFSYSCSACEFDIHLHCALTHNPHPSPSPHIYPQNSVYPPPNPNPNPTPIHTTYPPQPQPQTYPPPPQTQSQSQPQTQPQPPPAGYPPTQHYPSPNPTPQNYATTAPIDSTVVNATPTTAAYPPQPPVPQAKPTSTIKHFSHPHALKLVEIEKENAKVCSACECELSGTAYCCTEPYCTFNLHKNCFDSPCEVKHKSHPQHPLTLLATPPHSDGFTCNACLKGGKAFAYNCAKCSYDLHIDCIRWPETVTRPDHEHSLALYYKSPYEEKSGGGVFGCDVCKEVADDKEWVYYCRECDFGTHLECVNSEMKAQNAGLSVAEEMMRLQQQKMNLDFQMQMARQQAQFMTSIANSWKNF